MLFQFSHSSVTVAKFSVISLITEIMASDSTFASMFTGNWENPQSIEKELEYEPLSKRLMTIWTNFAKTGYGLNLYTFVHITYRYTVRKFLFVDNTCHFMSFQTVSLNEEYLPLFRKAKDKKEVIRLHCH